MKGQFQQLKRNYTSHKQYTRNITRRKCACGTKISTQVSKSIVKCARCIRLSRGE